MSDIVIYGVPGSPYLRSALLGFEEKRAPYRLAVMGMGEGRGEAHLRRHPFGRIPAMEHNDFGLYETQAILRYVDAIGPGPSLQPRDARAAARMDQIVGIVDWYVFPSITVGVCAERLMSQAFWRRPPDETNVTKALPSARVCIKELERLKGSAEFMAGDTLSIADLMLVPHITFFRRTPEGSALLQGTSLDAWLTRMSARPSIEATEMERLKRVA
jgi:glutathione S-transferase